MSSLVIYGLESCPACKKLKSELIELNISYQYIDLLSYKIKKEILEKIDHVPIIFYKDNLINITKFLNILNKKNYEDLYLNLKSKFENLSDEKFEEIYKKMFNGNLYSKLNKNDYIDLNKKKLIKEYNIDDNIIKEFDFHKNNS